MTRDPWTLAPAHKRDFGKTRMEPGDHEEADEAVQARQKDLQSPQKKQKEMKGFRITLREKKGTGKTVRTHSFKGQKERLALVDTACPWHEQRRSDKVSYSFTQRISEYLTSSIYK